MHWLIWTENGRRSWPPVHPDYVLLPAAMEAIAQAIFGDEWSGGEFTFEAASMAHGVPAPVHAFAHEDGEPDEFQLRNHGAAVRFWAELRGFEVPTYAGWKLAYDRFAWHFEHAGDLEQRKIEACRRVQERAMAGQLTICWRNMATGEMVPMSPNLWNCDADIAESRFALARINPMPFQCMQPIPSTHAGWTMRDNYFSQMTAWLFVKKDNLAALLQTVTKAPAMKAVEAKASAETRCGTWLEGKFADPAMDKTPKTEIKRLALAEITGLSGKAFERVWAATASAERKRAGSRGNRAG